MALEGLIDGVQTVDKVKCTQVCDCLGSGNGAFGDDYQTAVSLARQTTTSGTYQDKATLTTPALTGTYRVGWMATFDHADDQGKFRLYNVTDAAVIQEEIRKIKATTDRTGIGGFAEVEFTGAAKTFKIQFADVTGGLMQGIANARIEIWRVA